MEHPTKAEKVRTLMDKSPTLHFIDACKLLGFDHTDSRLKLETQILGNGLSQFTDMMRF